MSIASALVHGFGLVVIGLVVASAALALEEAITGTILDTTNTYSYRARIALAIYGLSIIGLLFSAMFYGFGD